MVVKPLPHPNPTTPLAHRTLLYFHPASCIHPYFDPSYYRLFILKSNDIHAGFFRYAIHKAKKKPIRNAQGEKNEKKGVAVICFD